MSTRGTAALPPSFSTKASPSSSQCPSCGAPIVGDTAAFCHRCGLQLSAPTAHQHPARAVPPLDTSTASDVRSTADLRRSHRPPPSPPSTARSVSVAFQPQTSREPSPRQGGGVTPAQRVKMRRWPGWPRPKWTVTGLPAPWELDINANLGRTSPLVTGVSIDSAHASPH